MIILNVQESRLNNVIEQNNMYVFSILNSCAVKNTNCYSATVMFV